MTTSSLADAVGAYGLPGAPDLPTVLAHQTWNQLLEDATRERIVPALAAAVTAGSLADPDPAKTVERSREATEAHERSMRAAVLLERALLDVADRLEADRIRFRVLKGSALAHLDYADPAERAFGDVDVLVPSDRFDDALHALAGAGAMRRYPEVRPGFDRRFGKGACVQLPDQTQIDVHRTFVGGPFGLTIDLASLFASSSTFTLGGRSLPALDREHRFLHSCFHAALGDVSPRVSALRDVAQSILTTPLDVDEALHRARAWRSLAVVARAVVLTWNRLELPSDPLSRWAVAYRPDPIEERSLRAYTGASRSYAAQSAAGLHAVRGVPAKVAYLRAVVVADRAHVGRHDGSYARRIRRGWRAWRSTRVSS